MNNEYCLGIWMDHSTAHLIEFTVEPMQTKTIDSKFTHQEKEEAIKLSENLMHHKEQHEQADFYKKISDIIRNYKEVILFGPTNAKNELFNILKEDHLFSNIKIEIQQADKMTENQQHAFVRNYFSPHKISFHK
jgi:stalled ribosome rescue protein Dom34